VRRFLAEVTEVSMFQSEKRYWREVFRRREQRELIGATTLKLCTFETWY